MAKKALNGSVDLLAKAMRQVLKEAVEEGTAPLREDMKTGFSEAAGGTPTATERYGERLRRTAATQVMRLETDENDAIILLTDAMRNEELDMAVRVNAAAGLLAFSATAAIVDALETEKG